MLDPFSSARSTCLHVGWRRPARNDICFEIQKQPREKAHLPHWLDAFLEEMIVSRVGKIVGANEVIVEGPKLLHGSKRANLFDVLFIVFLRAHSLQPPIEPESVRVLSWMMTFG